MKNSIPAQFSSMSTILEPNSQNPTHKQGKQQPAKLIDGPNPVKSSINSQSSVDLNTYPSCLESFNEDSNSVCYINTELSLLQPYNNLLSPVGGRAGRRPGFEPCRRRPVPIRPIEKLSRRQVTFSKRKSSLLRKAQQLSVLCNAEVGLIIFSSSGKVYDYASSNLDTLFQKYLRCSQRINTTTPKESLLLNNINHNLKEMQRNIVDKDISRMDIIKSLEEVELQIEASMFQLNEVKMELFRRVVKEANVALS